MTSAERSRGAHSVGWFASLGLHAMLAFGVLVFTQRITLEPQPAPFRWNVAMVAEPWKPLPPSSEPSTAIHTPVGTAPSPAPLPSPSLMSDDSRSAAIVEPTLPASDEPMIHRNETPPVLERSLSLEEADQPSATEEVSSPPQAVDLISPPSEGEAQPQQEAASPAQTSNIAPLLASAPHPNYAWLSEIILRRMQDLKRYPAEARLERAEGRVVLKAVIRSDGSIDEVEIFQSSGHQSLDRAAVELLSLAAPFHFPRPLEKPQLTVKIPMSYQLE
jgi:periplasmic protein TonB